MKKPYITVNPKKLAAAMRQANSNPRAANIIRAVEELVAEARIAMAKEEVLPEEIKEIQDKLLAAITQDTEEEELEDRTEKLVEE